MHTHCTSKLLFAKKNPRSEIEILKKIEKNSKREIEKKIEDRKKPIREITNERKRKS